MPNEKEGDIEAAADGDAPKQPSSPLPPPSAEREKNGECDDGKPNQEHIQNHVKPKHWTRYVEAVCAIVLVGITFYYARAAYRQAGASETAARAASDAVCVALRTLRETERSNSRQAALAEQARDDAKEASAESVKSAKAALLATINNFHLEQRSWISIAPPTVFPQNGGLYRVHMLVHNTGRTPAKDVVLKYNSNYFSGKQKPFFKFWGEPQHIGSVAPGGSVEFGGPQINTAGHRDDILYIFGSVTYRDVFGASHWITYCFFTHSTGVWGYYKRHNEIGDGHPPAE